jgi:hypothetical protein
MKQKYFLVYEVSFLSLMAALVYVLKTFFKTPIHLPGHSAIVWVIPFIIAIGLTKKFGSGTYIGILSGLLISTIGTSDTGLLSVFEYTAMGITMDLSAFIFKEHIDNILVGLILGAFGSFVKEMVHFYIASALSSNGNIILAGIGVAGATALIFGAAGGVISSAILNRVKHLQFPKRTINQKKSNTDEKQKKGKLA